MEKIFGKDVTTLKGKTTRRKAIPIAEDKIVIPNEFKLTQKNVILCIDRMAVNRLKFNNNITKYLLLHGALHAKHQNGRIFGNI